MSGDLLGTGTLVRLALRRDRFMVPAWALLFAVMAAFSASATAALYPGTAGRVAAANAVNATPAIVAMYGRIEDPSSLGALALFKSAVFGAVAIAILMVVLIVRHTRADEEAGRLELVGAGAVGRVAPLAAALIVGAVGCVLLGVLTAAGLVGAGLPAAGSLAFGAGWAAIGLLFAGVGAVTAQLTTGGRAAIGLGAASVGVAYVLRLVADVSSTASWLSWLSPIGWNQQLHAFAGERWAVLALPVLAAAALVPIAVALRRRRDLGSGLLADRPGPARGRLGTPLALAWRLQRPALLGWTVAVAAISAVLGSVAHTVAGLLDSPGMAAIVRRLGGTQGLTDAFLATELTVLAIIVAAYGIAAACRLRAEEASGHTEALLASAAGRGAVAAAHWLVAFGGVAWLLLISGFSVGAAHAAATGDPAQIGRLVLAAAARIPSAWVLVGLVVAIWALWPRATAPAAWGAYASLLVVGTFGELWGLPAAIIDLSPFVHSPVLPGPDPQLAGLVWLTAITALLLAVGSLRFRSRDLTP